MEKLFVFILKKTSFTEELLLKYSNSIVFIKDTLEIFTHGQFFSIGSEWATKITTAESEIDALLSAVQALLTIYSFTTISDGVNSASATSSAKTIKFNATGKATVLVGVDGVTIGATGTTLSEGQSNGQTSVDGVSKNIVKGLDTAAYRPETYFYTSELGNTLESEIENVEQTANSKVSSVTGSLAIEVSTGTTPTVSLKIDNTTPGNVTLSLGTNGLKAQVTIPSATVTGITAEDKVLSLVGTKLSTTLSLGYDSKSKKIQLKGIDSQIIAEIDATEFIKDGMVQSVSFDPETKLLTITFNTDASTEDIVVDMTSLVDTYVEGSGINISGNTVSLEIDSSTESFLSLSASGLKLSGVQNAINLSKSEVIGTDSDTYSNNTIYGAKKYADSLSANYASSELGTKADNALLTIGVGSDGDYVTTTVSEKLSNNQNISVLLKILDINSASNSSKGVAEAYNTKLYIDNLLTWEEL